MAVSIEKSTVLQSDFESDFGISISTVTVNNDIYDSINSHDLVTR